MNIPKISDIGGTITGRRKIENSIVAFEGPMFAKVIQPGTSEPKVKAVGEIGGAIVFAPRDSAPRPADPGSWPRSEADLRAEALANAARPPQLWTSKQATPKPNSKTPEIH